jgi:hypothetical protein
MKNNKIKINRYLRMIKKVVFNRYVKLVLLASVVAIVVVMLTSGVRVEESSVDTFALAYEDYRAVADEHEYAAYVPGLAQNITRQELDRILSHVLTEQIGDAERLEYSKSGIKLIKELEEQIDNIGTTGLLTVSLIDKLEDSASETDKRKRAQAEEIIEMAKERTEIISDIRGLSYRANHHTEEIFARIISDDGKLTDSHIVYLNNQILEAQEQFDKKTDLYNELRNLSNQLENKYTSFEDLL